MGDLVSVVVPIYNVQDYLRECIDSIINQTYANIEIILVDDGSPDECGQICDVYASQDKRIQVIHKKNGGLSDARNCGMAKATGQYITFVDSDDFIHIRYIEILLELAKDKQADIVAGDFSLFRESDEHQDKVIEENEIGQAQILSSMHLYDDNFINRMTMRLTVAWGKLYKRELWNGIQYPVGKIHEDTFTTWKLMEKAQKVVYVEEPLYYWRENLNSITRGEFSLAHLIGLNAYQEQLEYFIQEKKQRYIEIVFAEYMEMFFWCYNRMNDNNMEMKPLKPYLQYIRKNLHFLKISKNLLLMQWVKYYYLAYYKIPKLIR